MKLQERMQKSKPAYFTSPCLTQFCYLLEHSTTVTSALTWEDVEEANHCLNTLAEEPQSTRHGLLKADLFGPTLMVEVEVGRLFSSAPQILAILPPLYAPAKMFMVAPLSTRICTRSRGTSHSCEGLCPQAR